VTGEEGRRGEGEGEKGERERCREEGKGGGIREEWLYTIIL